jgi:group I intron endonuclease
MFGIVYKITNVINGKIYIGRTVKPLSYRWVDHLSETRRGSELLFHKAIRKYGEENFKVEELSKHDTDEELNAAEIAAIALYRSHERECGYNLTYGGEGMRATDETRKKISEAAMGNTRALGLIRGPQSEEHKRKLIEARTGKKRSPEAIAKFSATMKGHIVSDETKQKISDAHKGRKFSIEHRQKLGESRRGKPLSEDHKLKLSIAGKGRILSEEHKRKIGAAHKARHQQKQQEAALC